MAHLNFEPAPSVQPETRPPADYQQIQTNPREFGSAIGAGLEHLGAGVTDVSHLYGQIAADDQVNHVISGLDDLQSKMLSLRGKDAMDQAPAIRQQMSDLMNQARGNLFTADQIIQFNNQARILYSRADRTVVDHADQQLKVWGAGVNKSAQDLALSGAAQAAASGDMVGAEAHTQDAIRAGIRNAQLQFGTDLSPEIAQNVAREARAQSLRLQTNAMIPTNPAGAKSLLDQNAQYFNPLEYEALSQRLQGHIATAVGAQVNNDAWGHPAAPTQSDPRGLIPFIRQTAQKYGIDPNTAVRVAQSEGLANPIGDGGTSFGAFQLHTAPGAMGEDFRRDTGLDPSDPKNERATIDYALSRAATGGWSPFHGASRAGIANNEGLKGGGAFMGPLTQQPPGLADVAAQQDALAQQYAGVINRIENDPRVQDNPIAQQHALAQAEQRYRAEDLRLTSQMRAITERRDAAADQYVQRAMQGEDPSALVTQIAQDSTLDRATRENLWETISRHAKQTDPTQAYGPGFWALYQRAIAPPDGQLAPLTDPTELYRHAGPSGDLTLAGVQELTQTMQAMRRPEQAGDTKLQAGALAYAKHQLSFEADYGTFKVRDPKGEDSFNIGFLPAFMQYWQKGLAAGKSPEELVGKKEIDSLIAPYKRPPAELMRDQLQAGTEEAAIPQVAGTGPPAPAIAALRANPTLRDQFDAKYGAGSSASVLGPPGPSVPMAH